LVSIIVTYLRECVTVARREQKSQRFPPDFRCSETRNPYAAVALARYRGFADRKYVCVPATD
jgi:hypothetical protein